MKKILNYFINFLFPKVCSCCKQNLPASYKGNICNSCLSKLPKNDGLKCSTCDVQIQSQKHCYDCSHNKNYFDLIKAPYKYEKSIKILIHNFKYSNRFFLAKDFSDGMVNIILENDLDKRADIIIPVPLFITRRFLRGYNQADLLAKEISKKINIKYENKILIRKFYTKAQFLLNRKARQENLQQSFYINKKYTNIIKSKNILLVDDIVTTCATVNSCAKILKQAGAKKVFVISIARTSF
jgi:ComF family protein